LFTFWILVQFEQMFSELISQYIQHLAHIHNLKCAQNYHFPHLWNQYFDRWLLLHHQVTVTLIFVYLLCSKSHSYFKVYWWYFLFFYFLPASETSLISFCIRHSPLCELHLFSYQRFNFCCAEKNILTLLHTSVSDTYTIFTKMNGKTGILLFFIYFFFISWCIVFNELIELRRLLSNFEK